MVNTLAPGIDLDDGAALASADRSGLLRHAALSGAQARAVDTAVNEGALARLPGTRPRSLVVVARRAVPIAASRLVLDAVAAELSFPAVVVDHAPTWIGPLDVIIVMGDDPGDPAMVAAVDRAVRRGCGVVVATPSEGPMRAAGAPHAIPMPPRVAVPEIFATCGYAAVVLAVLRHIGPGEAVTAIELGAIADVLDDEALRGHPEREILANPAKSLASKLLGNRVVFAGDATGDQGLAAHAASTMLRAGGMVAASASLLEVVEVFDHLAGPAPASDVDPIFHDPEIDGPLGTEPVKVVVVSRTSPGTGTRSRAALLGSAADYLFANPQDSADDQPPGVEAPVRSLGQVLTNTLQLCVRLDMAAAYARLARSH
ncbi:tobH protein [Hoyosella sp. G463]|uniref:TobH protein n=1 Tax=Lolliginicoccus lacisalsi TaxID=2742202 RepID=A0A927JDZ2_9ACTN|nr:tobH protein [Lolliginicoccus lacisalsi]MBD8506607.1 tobH protein [Lolliginicoccus lacisalsi]